ncbi:MAG: FAD:protein FMN transferase [Chitinophagales bacterium]
MKLFAVKSLICLFLSLSLFNANHVNAQEVQWYTDIEAAKAQAEKTQMPILLVFSGSDWCKPCMKLKEQVLKTPDFEQYASKNLVLVELDFPAQKKNRLSKEQTAHNEGLAEKYNSKGAFPAIIVIDHHGKRLGELGYKKDYVVKNYIAYFASFAKMGDNSQTSKTQTKVLKLMGSRFEVSAVHEDKQVAWNAINAGIEEMSRIEKLISSWDENSQTSEINRKAGMEAVKVDKELYSLIHRALKVSKLTKGAFDISFASMERVWKFDGSMNKLPTKEAVAASVEKVNYQNIVLDSNEGSVFLKEKGMRIGFGAIGKGYAANRAKKIMQEMGIESGLVSAGGDLIGWGEQEDGTVWKIGIADPGEKDKVFSWLSIVNQGVVTSGNYEKFAMIDGQRYAHIIDPRTGMPVTGLKSVSIICPDAELADALATSVFVLGEEEGLNLVNQLKGIECLLVTDQNEIKTSENLALNYYE